MQEYLVFTAGCSGTTNPQKSEGKTTTCMKLDCS